jgi:hypothetical protein
MALYFSFSADLVPASVWDGKKAATKIIDENYLGK